MSIGKQVLKQGMGNLYQSQEATFVSQECALTWHDERNSPSHADLHLQFAMAVMFSVRQADSKDAVIPVTC